MALVELRFLAPDPDTAIHHAGRVVVLAESELPLAARPLDRRANNRHVVPIAFPSIVLSDGWA